MCIRHLIDSTDNRLIERERERDCVMGFFKSSLSLSLSLSLLFSFIKKKKFNITREEGEVKKKKRKKKKIMNWIGIDIVVLFLVFALCPRGWWRRRRWEQKRKVNRKRRKSNKRIKKQKGRVRENKMSVFPHLPYRPRAGSRISASNLVTAPPRVASYGGDDDACPSDYWYLTTLAQFKNKKWLVWQEGVSGKQALRFDTVDTTQIPVKGEKEDRWKHAKWQFRWPVRMSCRERSQSGEPTRWQYFLINNPASNKTLQYTGDPHHGVWGVDYGDELKSWKWDAPVARQIVNHPVDKEQYWRMWFVRSVPVPPFPIPVQGGHRHLFSLGFDGGEAGAIEGQPPNDDRSYWVLKSAPPPPEDDDD